MLFKQPLLRNIMKRYLQYGRYRFYYKYVSSYYILPLYFV